MYKRTETRPIFVGGVQIGGQDKVVIQSMCNTKTKDIEATVNQILKLEKLGCEIIRVACLDVEDAKAIKFIKEKIHIPIVADIHFDYKIALQAVESGVDKIRINPGNIGDEEKTKAVVEACKKNNIPIRIGWQARCGRGWLLLAASSVRRRSRFRPFRCQPAESCPVAGVLSLGCLPAQSPSRPLRLPPPSCRLS